MNADFINALRQVMQQIKTCLDEHGDQTVENLKRVANGELAMVETLTPEETEHVRVLFGWIAHVGPHNVWAKIQPVLADLIASKGDIRLDEIFVDPEFGKLLPELEWLKNKRTQARFAVLLASYICYDQFHYPQPETGVYNISGSAFQKLKWVYRYWFNQLEVAEKGSALEDYFAWTCSHQTRPRCLFHARATCSLSMC